MSVAAALVPVTWSRLLRAAAVFVAVPFALLIGVSRLYLGVHYPSDVLAGWAAAIAFAVGLRMIVSRERAPAKSKTLAAADGAEASQYLPLREEMRRAGEWLFRWRSYLPLVPLAMVLWVIVASPGYIAGGLAQRPAWALFCFGVSLLGLAVRVVTVGFVPRGTSGRNTATQVADTLNITGIYSLLRNPLYLGNFLMWLGVALLPAIWWLAVIIVLTFWLYYERIIFAEEEFLRQQFGEPYLRWARQTPAFLPAFRGWNPPALPFSVRTVLRRELSGFFGVTTAFALLNVATNFAVYDAWKIDTLWAAVFIGGLVVFATLVLLKRRRFLTVSGR